MASWPRIFRHSQPVLTIDPDTGTAVESGRQMLAASASLVTRDQVQTVMSRRREWQAEAWALYDEVPELRFGLEWQANAASRVRLYAGRVDPDGSSDIDPVDEGDKDAETLLTPLTELFGGQVGQGEMIRRLVSHLQIPGESYLVGFDDPETKARRWIVVSREEISRDVLTDKVAVMLPDRAEKISLDLGDKRSSSTMIRLWRPHPKIAIDPDSALIPLRKTLRQILNLDAHIMAASDSRLAGAGILAVPDEITTPSEQQSDGVNPVHADPFCSALITAMITPLKDRNSASAVAPMIVRGPSEAVDRIKHLSFATPFDARVQQLREAALSRMATGLDIPKEIIVGMSSGNHWSSWLVDEQFVKVAVATIMGLITEALTACYYRPALAALGVKQPEQYAVGFNLSALTQRPNRAPEALQAHEAGILSDEALLREMGFQPEDYPDAAERRRRLIEKIVMTQPGLAPTLLPDLGITAPGLTPVPGEKPGATVTRLRPRSTRSDRAEIPSEDSAQEQHADTAPPTGRGEERPALAASAAPVEAPPAPDDTEVEVMETTEAGEEAKNTSPAQEVNVTSPETETELLLLADAVTAAVAQADEWRTACLELGVMRALKRAGNWLMFAHGRQHRETLRETPLHEIHTVLPSQENWLDTMLDGAYAELTASLTARPCVVEAVDRYVRALIMAQVPHHRDYLTAAIEQAGCDAA